MPRPRVLLAITVYNGRAFVPRCITSAARLAEHPDYDLDVLVLDDASPEPGFSDDLAEWCREAGVQCYRTPQNLGIVRNVNLALLRARHGGYDHVIVANSDVIFASNVVERLLAVAASDETIGSVTAWSNNVSVYSIANDDPDGYLADQEVVDWVSSAIAGEFSDAAIDVPAGISFCILIPTRVIEDVGIMDPVFGRGYCEETDWSCRSHQRGWRVVLAPSAFVYHQGRGSTLAAGMISGAHTTVLANEAIIDLRYPLFRSQVQGFVSSDILPTAERNATRRIMRDAAAIWGYELVASWLVPESGSNLVVRCHIDPTGQAPLLRASFLGFHAEIPVDPTHPESSIVEFFGRPPSRVGVSERGDLAARVFASFSEQSDVDGYAYPERV